MKKLFSATVLAFLFLLTACTKDVTPIIETREVKIAVPVPCTVDLKGQRPELLTLPQLQERFATAPNLDTKAQLVTNQLLAYMGWLPVVEGAQEKCKMVPKPGTD